MMTPGAIQAMMKRGVHLRQLAVPVLALVAMAAPASAFAFDDDDFGMYCRREAGGAAGLVSAPGTWERIGKSPTFATVSPILGGACAVDAGAMSFAVGSEAAFTYVHYTQDKSLAQGWLTLSFAATGGTDEVRIGAHVMGGLFMPVGAGITFDWLPGNPHDARDGLEARLTEYWLGRPNTQLMLLYTVTTGRIP
jgi:hypothetical protein